MTFIEFVVQSYIFLNSRLYSFVAPVRLFQGETFPNMVTGQYLLEEIKNKIKVVIIIIFFLEKYYKKYICYSKQ